MDLQTLFNRVANAGETVTLEHFDKADYDSTVVMLRRKWRNHVALMKGFDEDHPCGQEYIRCTFNSEKVTGTYSKVHITQRRTAKVYKEFL